MFSKQDQSNYRFRIGFQYQDVIENVRKRVQNPIYFTNMRTHKVNTLGYIFILEKNHINQQNYNLFRDWFKENLFKKDRKLLIAANKIIYRKNDDQFFFKNIMMNGIEQTFIEKIGKKIKYLRNPQISKLIKNFGYVRFSDKVVIFSPNMNTKRFQLIISNWLINVGFDLRKKRFKMSHSRKKVLILGKKAKGNFVFPGFAMCGFFFQHYKSRKVTWFKKSTNIEKKIGKYKIPYQITITPSKKQIKQHLSKLSYTIFDFNIHIHYQTIIENLNPTIWNWCNYFRYYNCKARFRLRQYMTFCILKQTKQKFLKKRVFRRKFLRMNKEAYNYSETTTYLNTISVQTVRKILLHTNFTPKIFIQESKKFSIFKKDIFYLNKRFCVLENTYISEAK